MISSSEIIPTIIVTGVFLFFNFGKGCLIRLGESSILLPFYDTNLLEFTTNTFECYDIALTNGLNTVTLHATDEEGNTTTTNFSYTLDYSGDHTAPVLSLIWPTNGASIAGTNVTIQAQIDDNTATVIATINTNIVVGLVERNGTVWFNNLPLNSGTNTVTLTATDAAGNISTTNSSAQLNQTNVTVSGTIDNASDHVTVNGVAATVSGTNWIAANVLVNATGTAGLAVQVSDSGNNPLVAQNVYQPQPAQVVLESYQSQTDDFYQTIVTGCGWGYPGNVWHCGSSLQNGDTSVAADWSYDAGGVWHYQDIPYDKEANPYDVTQTFPAGENGYSPRWENVNTQSQYEGEGVDPGDVTEQVSESSYNHTQTHVMIEPAGQQQVGQSTLYLVQAQVTNEDTGLQLPGNQVQVRGATLTDVSDTNGIVWSETLISAPQARRWK